MKSYIPKMIAAAGLYLTTLLGGCGLDADYRLYEDVSEADGLDVELYGTDQYSVMKLGEFDKTRGEFKDSRFIVAHDCGKDGSFEEIRLENVGIDSRLEKLATPAKLREISNAAKASDKGIGVDFGK